MASNTGHLVCHGATCECKYGTAPDTLLVETNPMQTLNTANGEEKLAASTMDIGTPFEKKTFGSCKKQSFNPPCKPNILEWQDPYEEVTLQNGGKILLEGSKAVCAIAGEPCVSITWHGQTEEASEEEVEETNEETHSVINPLVNPKKEEKPLDGLKNIKMRGLW